MMKKFFLTVCSCFFLFALWGNESGVTGGVWYISFPENSGKIMPSEAAFRFNPDGRAEMVYSEKMAKEMQKMRVMYKKQHGEDFPQPEFTWNLKNGKLHIRMTMPGMKNERMEVFVPGIHPQVMFPENRQFFVVLARKGAELPSALAKQFLQEVQEANRDKFADDLKLPENVKLAEPEKEISGGFFDDSRHWKNVPGKLFQHAVLSAINNGARLADDAKCDIPSLARLLATEKSKAVLLQYLACHQQWRLYPEIDGSLHAVRYFCDSDGEIVPRLHQYYSWSMPTDGNGKPRGDSSLRFQFRFDIGFGGKAWNRSAMYPRDKTEREGNNWHTRFWCGSALVDIYDESLFPGRQMTAAALDFSEKEFALLLANLSDWKKLLPVKSSRMGTPDLVLRDGMQGGIYEAFLWCNPGEKGVVYLKAFEITKGTPLSVGRLKNATVNVSGWSGNPEEQFCSGMHFTIFEGEWNQFYGARFEVWFKPDKGGAERKLFEKNYKIQGWTR